MAKDNENRVIIKKALEGALDGYGKEYLRKRREAERFAAQMRASVQRPAETFASTGELAAVAAAERAAERAAGAAAAIKQRRRAGAQLLQELRCAAVTRGPQRCLPKLGLSNASGARSTENAPSTDGKHTKTTGASRRFSHLSELLGTRSEGTSVRDGVGGGIGEEFTHNDGAPLLSPHAPASHDSDSDESFSDIVDGNSLLGVLYMSSSVHDVDVLYPHDYYTTG